MKRPQMYSPFSATTRWLAVPPKRCHLVKSYSPPAGSSTPSLISKSSSRRSYVGMIMKPTLSPASLPGVGRSNVRVAGSGPPWSRWSLDGSPLTKRSVTTKYTDSFAKGSSVP